MNKIYLSDLEFYVSLEKDSVPWSELSDEKKMEYCKYLLGENGRLSEEVKYLKRLNIAQATKVDPNPRDY